MASAKEVLKAAEINLQNALEQIKDVKLSSDKIDILNGALNQYSTAQQQAAKLHTTEKQQVFTKEGGGTKGNQAVDKLRQDFDSAKQSARLCFESAKEAILKAQSGLDAIAKADKASNEKAFARGKHLHEIRQGAELKHQETPDTSPSEETKIEGAKDLKDKRIQLQDRILHSLEPLVSNLQNMNSAGRKAAQTLAEDLGNASAEYIHQMTIEGDEMKLSPKDFQQRCSSIIKDAQQSALKSEPEWKDGVIPLLKSFANMVIKAVNSISGTKIGLFHANAEPAIKGIDDFKQGLESAFKPDKNQEESQDQQQQP